MKYRFRECRRAFAVTVLVDGKEVYRNREYRFAAEWAKSRYKLTDAELMAMYDDYRDDRDNAD